MEKILLEKEIARALLAFRSKEKNRQALSGICKTAQGHLAATDGKRLIALEVDAFGLQELKPGNYTVISSKADSSTFQALILEPMDLEFPDIYRVLPTNSTTIRTKEGQDLACIYEDKDPLPVIARLYDLFHLVGCKINPLLVLDLPQGESGWTFKRGPGEYMPLLMEATRNNETAIKALFMPLK